VNNTPDTNAHTHDKNNISNPQTNTSLTHLTTLEGGATTVKEWEMLEDTLDAFDQLGLNRDIYRHI